MNQASGLLLDTDVVAEVRSDSPDPAVIKFLRMRRHQRLYLSVLTIGELYRLHGETSARASRDKSSAQASGDKHSAAQVSAQTSEHKADHDSGREWVEELRQRFPANILPIDAAVAVERAPLASVPGLDAMDSLIAATALRHRLTVVCRDVNRFAELGLNVVTPFSSKP